MLRWNVWLVVVCTAVVVACGGGPTSPSPSPGSTARLSRTRFLAFGDSITLGEVSSPVGAAAGFTKLVVVPAASYPSVLQGQLAAAYPAQRAAIAISNMGKGGEPILEGRLRFDSVFAASQAEVVLLMEGVVNLDFVGPDTSTAVMREMVQRAKNGNARVFVGSMIPSPAARPKSVGAAHLTAYNNVLQVMSAQEGVTYVDLYTSMLAEAGSLIGSDGLHPTEAGYRRIADLFFTAVRATLEEL